MARRDRNAKVTSPVVEQKIEEQQVEGLTYDEVQEEPETVEGIVDGVDTALNIRKKPEIKPNNQIGIVGRGTKIIIVDPKRPVKNEGEEWYKVLLNNVPGYAMKKYILIK